MLIIENQIMTAQARDIIKYNGNRKSIASEPLKMYLDKRKDVKFIFKSTALIRGYIGTWEVKNNKLYLVALLGFIENKKQVGLDFLFPKKKEVFASWFTGDIKIPNGKMIKRINLGYESIFENELILTFNKGILNKETLIDNIK